MTMPAKIFKDQPTGPVRFFLARDDGVWFFRMTEPEYLSTLRFDGELHWREIVASIVPAWSEMAWFVHETSPDLVLIRGVPSAELPACSDCGGSGEYVGFLKIEDCDRCAGSGIDPSFDVGYEYAPIKMQGAAE